MQHLRSEKKNQTKKIIQLKNKMSTITLAPTKYTRTHTQNVHDMRARHSSHCATVAHSLMGRVIFYILC